MTILLKLWSRKYILLAAALMLGALWLHGYGLGRANQKAVQVAAANTAEIVALEAENASLRAIIGKHGDLQRKVRNATQGITPGMLPAYTSRGLDCLRGGAKDCVQPAAAPGGQ